MKRKLGMTVALLLCAASAGAQMYKWTDAKGGVHFSDQPPPADARKAERKTFDGGAATVGLPYALARAAKNSPVVLYTTAPCDVCDQGRALLQRRGIPFAEKTVQSNDDQQKLKEAGSDGQLPLLLVGSSKRIGFEAGAWNAALTDAAYPLQRRLPTGWQNPPAVSAAAPRPPAPAPEAERAQPPAALPQPGPDATPGFRF